jgi:hypothetical protein
MTKRLGKNGSVSSKSLPSMPLMTDAAVWHHVQRYWGLWERPIPPPMSLNGGICTAAQKQPRRRNLQQES